MTDACSKTKERLPPTHSICLHILLRNKRWQGDGWDKTEGRVSRSRDVSLCSLDNCHQRFGETYCFHLPSSKRRKKFPVYPYSKPHGITSDRLWYCTYNELRSAIKIWKKSTAGVLKLYSAITSKRQHHLQNKHSKNNSGHLRTLERFFLDCKTITL